MRRIGEVGVAELFERPGRRGVDLRRAPQVADRGGELAAAAVGLAALQVADHRVPLEGDGAAEGLDRGPGIVPGDGGVAVGNGLSVAALPLAQEVAVDPRAAQSEQEKPGQDPFHAVHVSRGLGTFRPDRTLTG